MSQRKLTPDDKSRLKKHAARQALKAAMSENPNADKSDIGWRYKYGQVANVHQYYSGAGRENGSERMKKAHQWRDAGLTQQQCAAILKGETEEKPPLSAFMSESKEIDLPPGMILAPGSSSVN